MYDGRVMGAGPVDLEKGGRIDAQRTDGAVRAIPCQHEGGRVATEEKTRMRLKGETGFAEKG